MCHFASLVVSTRWSFVPKVACSFFGFARPMSVVVGAFLVSVVGFGPFRSFRVVDVSMGFPRGFDFFSWWDCCFCHSVVQFVLPKGTLVV